MRVQEQIDRIHIFRELRRPYFVATMPWFGVIERATNGKRRKEKKPAPNQLGHVYFVILVTFSGFRFNPLLFAITSFYHFSACFSISHSYIDALC